MKIHQVYLAGPITGVTYDGCTEWRDYVKNKLPDHIETLSPMRGKQRLAEKASGKPILDCYEEDKLTSSKGINCRDYFDCKRADVIFVNFLGATRISVGTVMEIAWARAFEKPVICVMEKDNIHQHSMLNFACGFIVESIDEGIDILESVIGPDKHAGH